MDNRSLLEDFLLGVEDGIYSVYGRPQGIDVELDRFKVHCLKLLLLEGQAFQAIIDFSYDNKSVLADGITCYYALGWKLSAHYHLGVWGIFDYLKEGLPHQSATLNKLLTDNPLEKQHENN